MPEETAPLIQHDAITLGLLAVILGAIFYTSHSPHPVFRAIYKYVPALLLCYFIPSLFTSAGVIHHQASDLYYVASRFLLPACLVLLTLSIDFKGILNLGPKAVIMFLTGTAGILFGGPIAILLVGTVSPETVGGSGPDAVWRGLATVAGSWIGGGANQAAMLEIFGAGNELFSAMVAVDIIVANIWMAVLLFMAGRASTLDARMGADTSAIEQLKERVQAFRAQHARIPELKDLMFLGAVGFGFTAVGHAVAGAIAPWIGDHAPELRKLNLDSRFFWVIIIATTAGLALSFTRLRRLEGVGASTVGSAFLYILVATIGMRMDITAIADKFDLFVVGAIWMAIHAGALLIVARLIRAPVFYMAVGSQANVGGAASAPVVASAFHPSLAPVGVLLAVLGYALGTYAAWACGLLMQAAAG